MKNSNQNKSLDALHSYFRNLIDIKDEEFDFYSSLFIPKYFRKNEFILREGEVCKYGVFVAKGCLRLYSIDKKGEETYCAVCT